MPCILAWHGLTRSLALCLCHRQLAEARWWRLSSFLVLKRELPRRAKTFLRRSDLVRLTQAEFSSPLLASSSRQTYGNVDLSTFTWVPKPPPGSIV